MLFFLFGLLIVGGMCNDEYLLREELFNGYNKNVRPTENYNDVLNVNVSLVVQNIESFDQIQEKIELNIWLRKYWKNSYISWNRSIFNVSQLTLTKNDVWTPDIELINAAKTPEIYTLNGGMYLYPDGEMLWSMPAVYKITCPLDLKFFPFDTQICSIKFSSWSYDNRLIKMIPHGNKDTQIDVLDTFSHSEWDLKDYSIETYDEKRDCCPGKFFNVNRYNFKLKRYAHYYTLNMGMTISLVIVSFIIMMVKPDNLSRTGTAVFIPLTILALELTIAGKIPVVGYYTLMDIFFLTCFITSMMVSIESGIVYTMITSKSNFLYRIFENIYSFDELIKRYKTSCDRTNNTKNKHGEELNTLIKEDSDLDEDNKSTVSEVGSDSTTESTREFKTIETMLEQSATDGSIHDKNESVLDERPDSYREAITENSDDNIIYSNKIDTSVIRTINYDNKDLTMTFKEFLMFNEISNLAVFIDNICLVFLPTVFFVIIIVIFSYN